jgi:hypothetical protein
MKGDNLFVAEFDYKQDMERALLGSPWVVGKHSVLVREYDECLKPSKSNLTVWTYGSDSLLTSLLGG